VLVPETYNVLINPHHADAARIKRLAVMPYPIDSRLLPRDQNSARPGTLNRELFCCPQTSKDCRILSGPFSGPCQVPQDFLINKTMTYGQNVVPSRPTNKNNDLRNNPPAETVRTEICTETFKTLGLNPAGGRNSPPWRRTPWAVG
jgi:hypothetical protein